jgi:Fuc2NAc and GlcNAc transferase
VTEGGAVFAITLASLVVAFAGTRLVSQVALRQGLMDVPNSRSSHQVPTPRGGGLAIVVATTLATVMAHVADLVDFRFFMAFTGGGLAVALIGLIDDRVGVAPKVRLLVHFAAALWALAWLGGVPPLQLGDNAVQLDWLGYPLGAVCIVWSVNLFNFMDGIDGLAASEAAFVSAAACGLLLASEASWPVVMSALAFCAANLGFLAWNWPPARIFMGDVGSGYLGYAVALLALSSGSVNGGAVFAWLILGGVFFVDATTAVIRRWLRGEAVHEAHRTHAYQWLARRWGSHRRVTLTVLTVNTFWLAPLGYAALRWPQFAYWVTLIALVPLIGAACIIGSGRPET